MITVRQPTNRGIWPLLLTQYESEVPCKMFNARFTYGLCFSALSDFTCGKRNRHLIIGSLRHTSIGLGMELNTDRFGIHNDA